VGAEAAFRAAVRRLGDRFEVEAEYGKVYWRKAQHQRRLRETITGSLAMLKNYVKVAVRALIRYRAYSAINILGLSVGLAVCMLMLLFVQDEFSYDRHHEKADRIYRVAMAWGGEMNEGRPSAITTYRLAPALKNDFPDLEHVIRFSDSNGLMEYEDQAYQENRVFYADADVFEVFDIGLLRGDAATALQEPFQVLLSESTARKYFGAGDPMGKVMQYRDFSITVAGVFADFPPTSHYTADFLISERAAQPAGVDGG
jgi:putative ABC transport system permease protein